MKLKSFLKNNNIFFKDVILSTFIGGIASIFGYYFNILLARGLSEKEFGIYSAALGIIYLIQIPSLAISSAITKLVANNRGKDLRNFKKKIFMQLFIASLVFSTIFYLLSPFVSNITHIPQQYMISLTVVLFLSFFSPITRGILYGIGKPSEGNLLTLIESGIRIVIGIVAVKIYQDSATLPILAFGLPLILTGIVFLPFVGRKENGKSSSLKESINWKNVCTYFLIFLFLSTPYTLDLSLVNPSFRPEYSALSLIGKIVYFASIMISSVMFSRLANLKKRSERKKVFKISLGITIFIGLVISLIYRCIPNIINTFVYGGKYLEISQYLWIVGIGMTLYAITYLIYNYFIIENFTKSVWWLIFITIVQILFFTFRNNSLEEVVVNQFVLYIVLFVGSLVLFLSKKWTIPESNQ